MYMAAADWWMYHSVTFIRAQTHTHTHKHTHARQDVGWKHTGALFQANQGTCVDTFTL